MLLEDLGVLATAQDLTAGAADSENVIDLGAIADVGFIDMWLSIITETAIGGAAGTSSTFSIALVVGTAANLTTFKTVLTIDMLNDVADPRIAAVDRNIANCEVGMMVSELADATYRYLGLICTLADGNGTATLSINAAISPSKPRTKDDVQVTRSNVGVPT
jgi:hypothetical protein